MGNLVAAAAQGVQVEHGDQPLHLRERAALGWVCGEGQLCPRGRFGPRLAKLWWWGRLDRTPPKIPPPPPPSALAALMPWCLGQLLELQGEGGTGATPGCGGFGGHPVSAPAGPSPAVISPFS